MDEAKAERFAEALSDLCKQHGVMIWTAAAVPIMASDAQPDDEFRYEAMDKRPEFGSSVVIRRVLGRPTRA